MKGCADFNMSEEEWLMLVRKSKNLKVVSID